MYLLCTVNKTGHTPISLYMYHKNSGMTTFCIFIYPNTILFYPQIHIKSFVWDIKWQQLVFYFFPSPAIGVDGYCRRFMRPPAHLSAILNDFRYRYEFDGVNSNMMQITFQNGHARLIIACSMELWNFSWLAWTRSDGCHYRLINSSRILAIGLKYGGVIHSNIKLIAIENGSARPILCVSNNFEVVYDRLWLWSIPGLSLVFGRVMNSSMK